MKLCGIFPTYRECSVAAGTNFEPPPVLHRPIEISFHVNAFEWWNLDVDLQKSYYPLCRQCHHFYDLQVFHHLLAIPAFAKTFAPNLYAGKRHAMFPLNVRLWNSIPLHLSSVRNWNTPRCSCCNVPISKTEREMRFGRRWIFFISPHRQKVLHTRPLASITHTE